MKTLKFARTAAAALALFVGFAQASPLVTQWTVTDFATFVPASVMPGGNTGFNPVLSAGNTQLHWGDGSANDDDLQSALIITNGGSTLVNTGVLTPTVSITHQNNPIYAPSLTSVDILAALTLVGTTPLGGPAIVDTITFGVKFIETPNGGSGGFCADGAAVGSGGVNINGCADIFVISNDALNFPLPYDSDGAINGYDPELYFVSFFADGFNTLPDKACEAAGAAHGCRGFETAEAQDTTAVFQILITSVPFETPEPGSMALAAGALAALAWVGRRRQRR